MNIINEKLTEYFNSFYQPVRPSLGALRERCEADRIPLILRETEMFLRTFLEILQPSSVLEIGTAYGYSSLFFAGVLPEARITTIEISPEMAEIAAQNIREEGCEDRIRVLNGEGASVLDRLCADGDPERYDMVFLDAAKSHYRDFFDRAEKLAVPGAVFVCDNILMNAWLVDSSTDKRRRHRTSVTRMHEFLDYLYSRKDLSVSLLSCGDGLAIIKLYDRKQD